MATAVDASDPDLALRLQLRPPDTIEASASSPTSAEPPVLASDDPQIRRYAAYDNGQVEDDPESIRRGEHLIHVDRSASAPPNYEGGDGSGDPSAAARRLCDECLIRDPDRHTYWSAGVWPSTWQSRRKHRVHRPHPHPDAASTKTEEVPDEKVVSKSIYDQINGFATAEACRRCVVPAHLTTRRLIYLGILSIWVGILWIMLIGKVTTGTWDDYLRHFTNWMWTYNTIYYTLDLVTLGMLRNRAWEHNVLLVVWWNLFGNVWLVFFLVFILLYDNPYIVLDVMEEYGGDMYAGSVLVFERVFHVLPAVFALFALFMRMPDLILAMRYEFEHNWRRGRPIYLYAYIGVTFLLSFTPFLIYYICLDPNEVYGVNTPVWLGMVVLLSTMGSCVLLPVIFLSPMGKSSRSAVPVDWWSADPQRPSSVDVDVYHAIQRESQAEKQRQSRRRHRRRRRRRRRSQYSSRRRSPSL